MYAPTSPDTARSTRVALLSRSELRQVPDRSQRLVLPGFREDGTFGPTCRKSFVGCDLTVPKFRLRRSSITLGHHPVSEIAIRWRVPGTPELTAGAYSGKSGRVNALPPLKVVQLLGNACLSPTTFAQGPVPIPWTPMDPVVFSLLRRAALVDPQRPCGSLGAMPAAWLATVSRRCHSVDVFQQGRFLFPCQPLTSPLPKSQFHRTKGRLSFKDRSQRSSLVYLRRLAGLTERAEALREKPA